MIPQLITRYQSDVTQMLVIADLEEVFLPSSTIFVDPIERR